MGNRVSKNTWGEYMNDCIVYQWVGRLHNWKALMVQAYSVILDLISWTYYGLHLLWSLCACSYPLNDIWCWNIDFWCFRLYYVHPLVRKSLECLIWIAQSGMNYARLRFIDACNFEPSKNFPTLRLQQTFNNQRWQAIHVFWNDSRCQYHFLVVYHSFLGALERTHEKDVDR